MEGDAPLRDTEMADAADAVRNASAGDEPFAIAVTKYPVKVSPAAVVSATGTEKIGWRVRMCPSS